MTRIIIILILNFCLFGCVSLSKHNRVTDDMQKQITDKQGKITDISSQLETQKGKLKQLGSINVASKPTQSEEDKALSYKDDGSWRTLNDPEKYKNYLSLGLGSIWLEDSAGKIVETGYVPLDRYKAEPEIINKGDLVFRYFVNNKFNTKIAALAAVTASMDGEDFAKLKYEIVGTSRLKIPQDSLQSIAKKYIKSHAGSLVKNVYLSTGFHIRKVSLLTYTKMASDVVVAVPVANVNGNLYSESDSELNSWHVDVKLLNLNFFVPIKDLERQNILEKGQTPFALIKKIVGSQISDSALQDITVSPELLTIQNTEELKKLVGKDIIKDGDIKKLNVVGERLLQSKSENISNP